jgi:RNA polymerase sigma factor (sigma-70 family)
VRTLLAERARFHRFITSRIGSETDADDLLQDGLLRALEKGSSLRVGERVVAWFYRILRNAVADHFRDQSRKNRMHQRLWEESQNGNGVLVVPADWEAALCKCFRGLLPSLNPRYAKGLIQIDLGGQAKIAVAREMGLSVANLDVVLYRAHHALQDRLKIFCGACSREHCLRCACEPSSGTPSQSRKRAKLNAGTPIVE